MSEPAHPYETQPPRAFWSRAVTRGWNPADLVAGTEPILRAGDRIVSAGSCFAANIVPPLERAGFSYLRTESVDEDGDRFGYGRYSAAYGNIYTARQFLQLVERAADRFRPAEDRWLAGDTVIDPFRPGLPYPAESEAEFDLLTASHLTRTREALEGADVLVFTLGLTEAWVSAADGAVFPACPGTVAGRYDPERHRFVNFGVAEVVADLRAALERLRALNPRLRVVLTVSPVPLVATATDGHVYAATVYSKSVLRVACEEAVRTLPGVRYFPAYEIVTGPDNARFFEADRRNVNAEGVACVVEALLARSEVPTDPAGAAAEHERRARAARALSQGLVAFECEEMMSDPANRGS